MNPSLAALLGALAGLLVGAVAVMLLRSGPTGDDTELVTDAAALPEGVVELLAVLRAASVAVDGSDRVVYGSSSAVTHGLVRRGNLVPAELRHLARQVRRDGVMRSTELELPRGPGGEEHLVMRARVAPLGERHVVILAEDATHARRLDDVRRDFVANVSHELKTPVGGIALLAEAVADARDDPEAVARFAGQMEIEASRLTRLVKEIVDLSRLQTIDVLDDPDRVELAVVVEEAMDHTAVAARSRNITVESSAPDGLQVLGDEDLLVTAVRNLITNAVNYSESQTRVAVVARRRGDFVEVSVSDQGSGIPAVDQHRIFERFYRIDPARSRATGGTGLGLAIVKHVCANHGGDVTVWSEPGHGSTFTIRLPAAPAVPDHRPVDVTPGGVALA